MAVEIKDLLSDPSLAMRYANENKARNDTLRAFVAKYRYQLAKTYRRWKADRSRICMIVDAATHPELMPTEHEGLPVSVSLETLDAFDAFEKVELHEPLQRVTQSLRARNRIDVMLTVVVVEDVTWLTLIRADGTRQPDGLDRMN